MVVFCPNIGVLSTVVLALVPLLRPYSWQSLLLPVLPTLEKMLDLLEAPVPFVLGVQVISHTPSLSLSLSLPLCLSHTGGLPLPMCAPPSL